ncbi:putative tetratricopeptide-like helical domain superfamily [Dioscorea sansibarensis]
MAYKTRVRSFSRYRSASLHTYHLSCALDACADACDLRAGAAAHAQALKLHHSFSLSNKLLKLYTVCGHFHLAHKLFDKMPQRDVVSFNTLITASVRAHHATLISVNLYSRMRADNVNPNHITISALLGASSHVKCPHFVEQLHAHAIHLGLSSNGFVGSALVNEYERHRGLDEAFFAFQDIAELDLVSWNVMIDACARSNSKRRAVDVFSHARRCSEGLDSFSFTSVLKTCSELQDLRLGIQLHCIGLKLGLDSETPFGNSLVTMYSRCDGKMDSAVLVFQQIPSVNIVSWTAIISGLAQNLLALEAIGYYKMMLSVGVIENEFCFASVLPAYSIVARLEQGRQVHARIIKSVYQSDTVVGNALIDMYFKCGCMEDAKLAFETMKYIDTVSWTTMILGFGQHGKSLEAIEIFRAMESIGFKPDKVTFLAVLSACSHGGLTQEGLDFFHSMTNDYCYNPKREHYACIIDMFGRAGKFKEAEKFMKDHGIESDSLAWEALLGACGMHGEKELGEKSAKEVMKLEPEKDGPYVLLSNLYAEKRMWEEKDRLRQRLEISGLKKAAASSWFSCMKDDP